MSEPSGLGLYDATAADAAAVVIGRYSTSFAVACRLLGQRVRRHVRNVYALVRVADEIVDGPASQAGLSAAAIGIVLDDLERESLTAMERGFSANLVVHAFAATARECSIGQTLVTPFFAAMRSDLTVTQHDAASHDAYVYGSAEVVGLMCLQVFLNAGAQEPRQPDAALSDGARRLGRAFQDVNFLRDAAHDTTELGRDYLGLRDDASRSELLGRIDDDLRAAAAVIPSLPPDCRAAVTIAHDLFAELSARLRHERGTGRVRVPDGVKAAIAARAWLARPPVRRSA